MVRVVMNAAGCVGKRRCLFALFLSAWISVEQVSADRGVTPDFEREVAPLLVKRCLECHQERDPSGGVVLSHGAGVLAGGKNGPVVVPGAPDDSKLFHLISKGEMPPEEKGLSKKLSDDEIAVFRDWIARGAAWPEGRTLDLYEATTEVRGGRDWWSLQPINPPEPPVVTGRVPVTNPIDAFVVARLEANGMVPAPPASRRDLIRRAYYDVIGLPPSFEEVKAFEADTREDAWERVVDRLLASPQFGEKWARHWLDLVRFAETCGYERDQEKAYAWRYRDWVVKAINDDLPYDQFVVQQLAGDEIPGRTEQTVIATGMLRMGTWNDEPNDQEDYKYERLEDMVHVTSSAFLGLTVKCARCHDHKFDPIPQTDYYAMAAVFWPGAINPRGAAVLQGGPTASELGYENVLGWTDISAKPGPLHLLKNGERDKPGDVVPAGVPTAVPTLVKGFSPPPEGARTTQRRLQLAQWIVNPENPLTPRVLVNRLWQHHFGAGLVRTPNNLGYKGDLPTHPELLDWLAAELVAGGWKMKPLHKMILMSQTYQQASIHPLQAAYNQQDASNHFLWHAQRRRLDAEALRDTMLFVSGDLDETMGGPSFKATVPASALEGLSKKDAAWQASPPEQQRRRSLYMYSARSLLSPMMTTFNFSDTVSPCGQRDVTIAPTQALALLNNTFAHERSGALAQRVVASGAVEPELQVERVWKYALGRRPSEREQEFSLAHLQEQEQRFGVVDAGAAKGRALASLCHVLLNSNEFIYVE